MEESLFSKVTETFAFCNSVEKSNTCMVRSEKQPFWKFREVPLLTGVVGLQYTVSDATKNEVLTKFIKCALKISRK